MQGQPLLMQLLGAARGFATQWDVHFDQFADLAQQMPVMVVEGNHERDWPNTGDRFQGTATDSGTSQPPCSFHFLPMQPRMS